MIPTASAAFVVSSPAFKDGATIPQRHGCSGEGVSPELDWTGAPASTAELLLIVEDRDANGFVHWLLTEIPESANGTLAEGRGDATAHPEGQGRNSASSNGWSGPCPPTGQHTYVFTLYALSRPMIISARPELPAIRAIIEGTVLGQARITGTYRKSG